MTAYLKIQQGLFTIYTHWQVPNVPVKYTMLVTEHKRKEKKCDSWNWNTAIINTVQWATRLTISAVRFVTFSLTWTTRSDWLLRCGICPQTHLWDTSADSVFGMEGSHLFPFHAKKYLKCHWTQVAFSDCLHRIKSVYLVCVCYQEDIIATKSQSRRVSNTITVCIWCTDQPVDCP